MNREELTVKWKELWEKVEQNIVNDKISVDNILFWLFSFIGVAGLVMFIAGILTRTEITMVVGAIDVSIGSGFAYYFHGQVNRTGKHGK